MTDMVLQAMPSTMGELTEISFAPTATTFEEWREAGRVLRHLHNSCMWWIGDWLQYGRGKFGESYSQVMDETDYAYDTLRRAAVVAETFAPEQRRQALTFSHHREVLYVEEGSRDYWLDKAEQEGWSSRRLREEITISRVGPQPSTPVGTRPVGDEPPTPKERPPEPVTRQVVSDVVVRKDKVFVVTQESYDEIEAWLRRKVNQVWMEVDLMKLLSMLQGS